MKRASFTPGPWVAKPVRGEMYIQQDWKFGQISEPFASLPLGATFDHDQQQANARLISCAPELLSTLELILPMLPTEVSRRVVSDVIAKARGGK